MTAEYEAAPLELRIGVAELRRRPGNRQRVEREVQLGDLAISTASVPPSASAHLDVVMESLSDGVTVSGELRVPWEGDCRRCLERTSGVVTAELSEVFKDRPDDADIHPVVDDGVDLGPAVHDAAVLALPLAPLCSEDCPGPDPEGFPVRTEQDPGDPGADPRWAALSELRFDSGPGDSLE